MLVITLRFTDSPLKHDFSFLVGLFILSGGFIGQGNEIPNIVLITMIYTEKCTMPALTLNGCTRIVLATTDSSNTNVTVHS